MISEGVGMEQYVDQYVSVLPLFQKCFSNRHMYICIRCMYFQRTSCGNQESGCNVCLEMGEGFVITCHSKQVLITLRHKKFAEKRFDQGCVKKGHLMQHFGISQVISILFLIQYAYVDVPLEDLEVIECGTIPLVYRSLKELLYDDYCSEYEKAMKFLDYFLAKLRLTDQSLETIEADNKVVKKQLVITAAPAVVNKYFKHISLHPYPADVLKKERLHGELEQSKQEPAISSSTSDEIFGLSDENVPSKLANHDINLQDGKCGKVKADCPKSPVIETEIPDNVIDDAGSDEEKDKTDEVLYEQYHSSGSNNKRPTSDKFSPMKMMAGERFAERITLSPHNGVAAGLDSDLALGKDEPVSYIPLASMVGGKSQLLLESEYGSSVNRIPGAGGPHGNCGYIIDDVEWMLTRWDPRDNRTPPRRPHTMPVPLVNPTRADLRQQMRQRNFRLASMVHLRDARSVTMAEEGLYLDEHADLFCCHRCDLEVKRSQWPEGEKPADVHRRLSPNCPLVNPAARADRGTVPHVTERDVEVAGAAPLCDEAEGIEDSQSQDQGKGETSTSCVKGRVEERKDDTEDASSCCASSSVKEGQGKTANAPSGAIPVKEKVTDGQLDTTYTSVKETVDEQADALSVKEKVNDGQADTSVKPKVEGQAVTTSDNKKDDRAAGDMSVKTAQRKADASFEKVKDEEKKYASSMKENVEGQARTEDVEQRKDNTSAEEGEGLKGKASYVDRRAEEETDITSIIEDDGTTANLFSIQRAGESRETDTVDNELEIRSSVDEMLSTSIESETNPCVVDKPSLQSKKVCNLCVSPPISLTAYDLQIDCECEPHDTSHLFVASDNYSSSD